MSIMHPYDEKCKYVLKEVFNFGPWYLQSRTEEEHTFDVVKRDWITQFNQFIIDSVSNRSSVVQAGGWQGMYPFLLSNMFENVYTFEPDPVNFHCLVQNCQRPNIFKFQAALGAKPGLNQFEVISEGGYSTGQGRIKHEGAWDENPVSETITVQTMTIDSLGLEDCGLIMSDTEGWGLELLKGAVNTLTKCKPYVIIESYHIQDVTDKEIKFLEALGYKYLSGWSRDHIFAPS